MDSIAVSFRYRSDKTRPFRLADATLVSHGAARSQGLQRAPVDIQRIFQLAAPRFGRLRCICLIFWSTVFVIDARAQVNRFFPPVVTPGEQATLKIEGKFPTWPVEFVCDQADVTVAAAAENGQVEVLVEPGRSHGIAWIRSADDSSVSAALPLLIEPIRSLSETEPNDHPDAAQELALPICVAGRLEKNEDVDAFRLTLKAGDCLVVSVIANQILRSPMDAVVQLCDLDGNVLQQSDDEHGLDPQLVYRCEEDCQRIVRLFAFPETPNSTIGFAGGADFVYLLRISTGSVLDHCLPLFANPAGTLPYRCFGWNLEDDAPILAPATALSPQIAWLPGIPGWQWLPKFAQASSLATSVYETQSADPAMIPKLPSCCSGHIYAPGEIDRFRLNVGKNTRYRAQVFSHRFGFPLDSELRLVDPKTAKVISRNDDQSRQQVDASLDFTATEDGELELQLTDLADSGSPRHAYSMVVEEIAPSVLIRSAGDVFAVTAGTQLDLPVAIERRDGFNKRLALSVRGLPDSITCVPSVSEKDGETSKSVVLKLSVPPEAKAQRLKFQITASDVEAALGKSQDNHPNDLSSNTPPAISCRYELRPNVWIEDFWLTVKPGEKPAE